MYLYIPKTSGSKYGFKLKSELVDAAKVSYGFRISLDSYNLRLQF